MSNSSPLLAEEIQLCKNKKGFSNQIAFGIMLAYFNVYIKFPSIEERPLSLKLISQIAKELDLKPLDFSKFEWNGRTAERYRKEIREHLGYHEAKDADAKLIVT